MTAVHDHSDRSCEKLFERLSEYIDGELPDDLCTRMESHMGDCRPCQLFLESLRRTVDLVGSMETDELPEDLISQLKDAADNLPLEE